MDLAIDHVPFAWHDLDEVNAEFDRLGLATEYGGVHDNGVTHMALLGFDDLTYVELIAERGPGDHDFWPDHIRADAGPAAWAIRVQDLERTCERLRDAGVVVRGPFAGARGREDGTLVEWERAEFGEDHRLPFAIEDQTPLARRVSPSPSVAGGPLTGLGPVVDGVTDLEASTALFRDSFGCPEPRTGQVEGLGTVVAFPGEPVALARPAGAGWLADRLERFPEGPCACLLETDDLDAAQASYPLADPQDWPTGRVAWYESESVGRHLGVIERSRD